MKKVSLILAAALLASLSACGEPALPSETDGTPADIPTDSADAYDYPALNLGGKTFTILNTAQPYNFYSALDFEEATGDALDDAVYERNRALEERFNFTLEVIEDYELKKANTALETAVLAGDDLCDAAFLRDIYMTSQLTQGMFADLQDVDGFHFDEPWWDTAAYEEARFGESMAAYYAYTDISFCDFEGTICVFFNEDMMQDLNLDFPYDLVREGKWTFDKLGEYMAAGSNLNGDESFTPKADGASTYGLVTWEQGLDALFFGMGNKVIDKDSDGNPEIAAFDDKYVSSMQKIIERLSVEGDFLFGPGSGLNYEQMLKDGRSLAIVAQLKAANNYRDMEDSYGILPIPKADESQDRYYCLRSYCYVMSIPITNQNIEDTAIIMDAMSYLTYTDVMDDFYDGRICMKTLRGDDSIEMMELIRESRMIDLGMAYGWSQSIKTAFNKAVANKPTDIVSALEALRPTVKADIDKVIEQLAK